MSIAAVQARVDEIHARFVPEGTASTNAAPPTSGGDFASVLDQASTGRLGGLDPSLLAGARTATTSGSLSTQSLSTQSLSTQSLLASSFASFTSASASGSTAGNAVVSQGMKHLGTPYLWGGTNPDVGLDCSALVQHAYRDIGVELPRVSRDQAKMGVEVDGLEAAQPGDLIAFGSPVDHISIYVGDGKILHAPRTGDVVKVADIHRPIATIRRVVASQPSGFSATTSSVAGGSAAEAQYSDLFTSAGQRHGVDPALLAAVASVESGFNPNAQSSAGAQGLMQFMPATAAEMGVDAFDPASAVDGAARYLRREFDRFGSVELAAAAYNAGAGAVSRYGGVPPYSETQNYVKKVLSAYEARR